MRTSTSGERLDPVGCRPGSALPMSLCLGLLAFVACSPGESTGRSEEWVVDLEPIQVLGVEEGPAELELSRVSDAVVLPGGDILIANSGTSELRQFSGRSEFVRRVGREGQGPGEFSGSPLFLQLKAPDTLVVFDTGNWRLTSIDTAGRFLASVDAASADLSTFEWYARVYPSAYLASDLAPSLRPCVEAAVARITSAHADWSAAFLRIDRLGYLWATALPVADGGSTVWNIYDGSGAPVASATLPAGFTPFSIAETGIVGRLVDTAGVERVARLGLTRKDPVPQSCAMNPAGGEQPDSSTTRPLRDAFSNVLLAQEGYYVDAGRYAGRGSDLRLIGMPDARLVIISADKRHWVGLLIDNQTGATCALGVGYEPPGWHDAVPQCT